jgi:hypothetical protein
MANETGQTADSAGVTSSSKAENGGTNLGDTNVGAAVSKPEGGKRVCRARVSAPPPAPRTWRDAQAPVTRMSA